MKSFIEHIQKSIYGPDYYQELLTQRASFSWKYYASLAMFLALFLTIVSSIALVPLIGKTLREFPHALLTYYPDDLEVRVINGHATSTSNQPYLLPLPLIFSENMGSSTGILHLGVIDTIAPMSLERFESYSSFFWITETAIMMRDNDGGVRVGRFDPSFNFVLNEGVIQDAINRSEVYFKFVAPIVVLVVFLGMIVMFTVELIYLIFAALFVFVMGRVLKQQWSYGTSYRICLHAVTLPLVLGVAFSLVNLGMGGLPLFSTILLLVVVFFNFRHAATQVPPVDTSTSVTPDVVDSESETNKNV